MRSKKNCIKLRNILMILSVLLLTVGCGKSSTEQNPNKETGNTGFIMTGPGSYDSADTAVIEKIDRTEHSITFYNHMVSKSYTLSYDGTTCLFDKYEQPLTMDQIKEGDLVDVTFLKSKKKLNSLALSFSGWSNEKVERYHIDTRTHNLTVGEDVFKITKDTLVFSGDEEIELCDINDADVLNFYGLDTSVLSIVIDKGHGYLRLSGDESFIGGFIEVGQNIIHPITEDMLLTVPEGSYQVTVSNKGGGGTKPVIINRNEEVTLDISEFKIAEPLFGQVLFAMKPSNAKLFVDGTEVDVSGPVSLSYGIHQLMAKADGYLTVTSYLKVAQETAGIEITLDPEKEEDKKTVSSGNSVTDSNTTNSSVSGGNSTAGSITTTGTYKVFVDAPIGAEVYLDGNYVGLCPVSFKKVKGPHVVTFRKTGCETRSYTIQVDEEDKDISFSFGEMIPNP